MKEEEKVKKKRKKKKRKELTESKRDAEEAPVGEPVEELKSNELKIPFEFNFWGAQDVLDLTETLDEKIEIKFN